MLTLSGPMMGYPHSAPNNLSLPKAAASTLTNKPCGLLKGWFEKEGLITVTASQRYAQYVPPASPEAHPEHPAMLKEPQVRFLSFYHSCSR